MRIYFCSKSIRKCKKCWGDSISDYTIPIKSLTSSDFNDLQFLKKILTDKKYVFIGESSHQVEEFYQLRARLINFLVSELDFKVIAFEHEKIMCVEPNNIKNNIELDSLLSFYYNSRMINSDSEGGMTLMELIAKSDIETTGFDIQFSGSNPNRFRIITQKYIKGIPDSVFYHDSLFCCNNYDRKNLLDEWNIVMQQVEINEQDKIAKEIRKNLENRINWLSFLPFKTQDIRDSLMAENITWLIRNIYPDEKIIFLAHNEHINKLNFNFTCMGELLPDTLIKESYVLGLTAYQGTTGLLIGQTVSLPGNKRNSLESILNSAGYDYVFCDFSKQIPLKNNSWMFEKIKRQSRVRSHQQIIPNKFFDGIIQIKSVNATSFDIIN